jgi:hypothetical protein
MQSLLTDFSSPAVQAESSGAQKETEEQPAVLASTGDQIAAAKAADAAVDSLKENSTYNPRRMRPKRCAGQPSACQKTSVLSCVAKSGCPLLIQ